MIEIAYSKLDKYCRDESYSGWDLFDGLNSEIFQRSPLKRSDFCQLAWIQFLKRSPINFRKIVRVPKGYNAKGLGLFVSGLVVQERMGEAEELLDQLKEMICEGYTGISWGYNFSWKARAFYVPKGKPNMVTTVFVANAFLDYLDANGSDNSDVKIEGIQDLVTGACEFILKHLILFEKNDRLCFGYIPGEEAIVHNASMLGAALLGRAYSITGNEKYYEKSKKAMAYSLSALNDDHSWPYGELSHHRFIDNFHTGFNLVALKAWMDFTGDRRWEEVLEKAYAYFLKIFWLENGCPKYYNNSLYPIDIHCSAQGIVTCLKLKEYDDKSLVVAKNIAKWAIENMQDKRGYFYYQKTKWFTNKIPYIRWSQAWMYYALALYISKIEIDSAL